MQKRDLSTLSLITMDGINFQKAHFVASYGTGKQLPRAELGEVIFCGRSNVGKSSLINALTRQNKLAKTSQKPGKTATINFFSCDGIYLVDLPGYGFASASHAEKKRWSALIDAYFSQTRSFNLVVCLVDARHDPQPLDYEMVQFLQDKKLPFIIALTKCDKLAKSKVKLALKRTAALLGVDELACVALSSKTKEGIQALQTIIENATR